MNKRELRQFLRAQHRGDHVRNRESALLCEHILASSIFQSAQVVGGYMPLQQEADVMPVITAALRQGKTLVLPLCHQAPHMTMHVVSSLEELRVGSYGILEPSPDAPIIPSEQIDLLLVPLEGIDHDGFRLGKGGGYYDRLLSLAEIPTLGCALSWQWTEKVPREPWDKPLCACADYTGIHWFDRNKT